MNVQCPLNGIEHRIRGLNAILHEFADVQHSGMNRKMTNIIQIIIF